VNTTKETTAMALAARDKFLDDLVEQIRVGEIDYRAAKRLLRQFDARRRQTSRAACAARQASEQSKPAGGHGGQPVGSVRTDNDTAPSGGSSSKRSS